MTMSHDTFDLINNDDDDDDVLHMVAEYLVVSTVFYHVTDSEQLCAEVIAVPWL